MISKILYYFLCFILMLLGLGACAVLFKVLVNLAMTGGTF